MIRSMLFAGVSAAVLSISAPAFAEDAAPAPSTAPQMTFGTWGFDPASLDPAVKPGDDFFAYANGKWIAANPIPPEYTRFGSFNYLDEKSKNDVQMLIDDLVKQPHPAGSGEQRIVEHSMVRLAHAPHVLVIPIVVLAIGLFVLGSYLEDQTPIQTDPQKWVSQDSQVIHDLDQLQAQTSSSSDWASNSSSSVTTHSRTRSS